MTVKMPERAESRAAQKKAQQGTTLKQAGQADLMRFVEEIRRLQRSTSVCASEILKLFWFANDVRGFITINAPLVLSTPSLIPIHW